MTRDLGRDLREVLPPSLDVPTDFYERVMAEARRRRRVIWAGSTGLAVAVAAVIVAVSVSLFSTSLTARLVPVTPPPVSIAVTPTPASHTTKPNASATPTAAASSAPAAQTSAPAPQPGTPAPQPTGTPTAVTPAVDTAIGVFGDCQHATVEPSGIQMACADNGFGIESLRWTSWTASSATASGTTWSKECKPNCAEGKIIYTPDVTVTLTNPVHGATGALVWSKITFSQLPPGYPGGPQPLPTGPI